MIKDWFREIALVAGIEKNTTSHQEKILSSVGGIIGIAIVYITSTHLADPQTSVLIVASMGASAVLVFAIPHGPLSQPWPVLGGHIISALIGVVCYQNIDNPALASAMAVGLAISGMYYLRCLHPPGGATALLAVIGGEQIHSMGFGFVIYPILINVVLLLLVAISFNAFFKWRIYPAYGISHSQRLNAHRRARSLHGLTQEDFIAALQQLDSFIDVTAEDLSEIFELAMQHAHVPDMTISPKSIMAGRYYSNGHLGIGWSIRQITQISKRYVHYETVAGLGKGQRSRCRRYHFYVWARYSVVFKGEHWVRAKQLPTRVECD